MHIKGDMCFFIVKNRENLSYLDKEKRRPFTVKGNWVGSSTLSRSHREKIDIIEFCTKGNM